jgi:hypothetical protein
MLKKVIYCCKIYIYFVSYLLNKFILLYKIYPISILNYFKFDQDLNIYIKSNRFMEFLLFFS